MAFEMLDEPKKRIVNKGAVSPKEEMLQENRDFAMEARRAVTVLQSVVNDAKVVADHTSWGRYHEIAYAASKIENILATIIADKPSGVR